MSELRYNVTTREWVVIAPERAKRPEQFLHEEKLLTPDREPHQTDCPFCPGHEGEDTPGETWRSTRSDGDWQVRCFPNRYPAFTPSENPCSTAGRNLFHRVRDGCGVHEVVAESPRHNVTLALQPVEEVQQVINCWHERFVALHKEPIVEHVIVFKNHGAAAGTSLEHPHSQIIGLPVVPSHVHSRLDAASRFYQKNQCCVFCRTLEEELDDGARIVAHNPSFVAFVPFAAYSPYSLWVFPRRHMHSFAQLEPAEAGDLARILVGCLGALYFGLKDPAYNLVLRSLAPPGPGQHAFHWYVAIVPRLGKAAGFELGTGMFINSSLPEADAAYLRTQLEKRNNL